MVRSLRFVILMLFALASIAHAEPQKSKIKSIEIDAHCSFTARHEDGGSTRSDFVGVHLVENQASRLFQNYLPTTDGPLFTVDAYGGLILALTKHLVATSQWQGDEAPEFQLTLARAFDENSGTQKLMPRFVISSASSVVKSVRFIQTGTDLMRPEMTQGTDKQKLVRFDRISINYTVVRPRENPFLFGEKPQIDLSNPFQTNEILVDCAISPSK